MSWLSKLTLRGASSRAGRAAAQPTVVTADPETCLMVFQNHWAQVSGILMKSELRSEAVSADDVIAVRNYTDQMMYLLAEERPSDVTAMGPILELVVVESVLEKLLHWSLCRGLSEDSKLQQLKLYDMLVGQSHQPLLRHKPILTPLMQLLSVCSEPSSPAVENQLVLLLNQICVSLAKEPSTLELFLYTRSSQSPNNQSPSSQSPSSQSPSSLLLFSILVPFIHREGLLGQQARDALLLLMAISADNHTVASFIADNSYFCPVLATGLSALYSSLPRKIEVRGDDWHALRREDWLGVSSLTLFMNSLEFCNAIIQVAHPRVQNQLVDYLHNGFLVPVMGPALHKTSIEEMIASTAYLDLFLRSITERVLLQTFLRFLLLHRHDNSSILDTLISRVNSNSRLCMVSLSLFRTLLNLSCEDIMLQLVLRYLIPCNHVMLSQRCAVKDQDFYGKAANKFLSLIPACCSPEHRSELEREEEHAVWAKGHGSPSVDTSSVTAAVPKPSTPSRLAFFMRQQSPSSESSHAHRSPSLGSCDRPGLASPLHGPGKWEEVSELEVNYLEYLQEARCSIDQCVRASRVWSAPYDGKWPDPSSFPPPPTSDCGAMSLCADHFGREQQRPAASPEVRHRMRREELENGDWDPQASHATTTPRNKKRSAVLAHGPGPEQGHGKGQLNGTGGKDRARLELRPVERGECCLLVKKVRRDSGAAPRGRQREVTLDVSKQCPAEKPETGQCEGAAGGQSVDSLIDELLEKAPAEHNGCHLNVESFTRELSDMEASMRQNAQHQEPIEPPEHTLLPSDEEEEEEQGFSSHCAPRVPSPTQPTQPTYTQPFTGPFIAVLFAKLDNMLQNSLYVNFLLTGIIAQLACYPQPLLRSFLLNTNMVFQPTVKSLIQVLGSVKNKIELFAATQEDFPMLLFKARKYLIARGKLDWTDSPGTVPPLRRSDTLVKSRKPSLGELILRHTHSPTRARQAAQQALQHVREGQMLHTLTGSSMFKSSAEKQNEALRVKNAVYCAVIFTEFLKELAAIAQEHSVTSPFLLEGSEE